MDGGAELRDALAAVGDAVPGCLVPGAVGAPYHSHAPFIFRLADPDTFTFTTTL
jgi:hypothetical protein